MGLVRFGVGAGIVKALSMRGCMSLISLNILKNAKMRNSKSHVKLMKFDCLFKKFLFQFSHFIGSFDHQLQTFSEDFTVLKNWKRGA